MGYILDTSGNINNIQFYFNDFIEERNLYVAMQLEFGLSKSHS